ncbi:MAG: adenylate/guanylate cyclase domain-containing protein [Candidatus Riflebacteria bacterium]|nr:adenylate/guanylate cyclase domain-containing protein [Candidatus Riflebacteria bacterium]
MKRTLSQYLAMALLAAALMALLLLLSKGGLLTSWALDRLWSLNGPFGATVGDGTVLNPQVVIAGIDNQTLRTLRGDRPRLSREIHARLVTTLTAMGARHIGFDITFDQPGDPAEDQALREAARQSGRVVTNCYLKNDEVFSRIWIEGRSFFRGEAFSEGFVDMPLDGDHFIRRTRLYAPKGELPTRVSLALAMYLADIGRTPQDVEYHRSYLVLPRLAGLSPITLPLDHTGLSLIGFLGKPGSIPTYSVADILAGKVPNEAFRDKCVLVGGTAEEFRDSFHTPFSPKGDMPGVEIHAHVLQNLFTNRLPREWSGPTWWALLLALAVGTAVFSGWRKPERALLWVIPAALAVLPLVLWLFVSSGLFLNMFDLWAALGLGWICATTLDTLFLRREKNTIARLFHRYVSPNLLNQLLEHPEAIALGGARRNAVVLFADVRGFTRICEELQPEEVITFLNTYFNAVTQIIFDHGGVLDKYIGDGLMAFFGVPIATGKESEQAVRAALAIRQALVKLRAEGQAVGDFPIREIGIGINGGEVVVGNVGSEVHQEYTLLGDTVNVAARLESLARSGEILVTGWVKDNLPPGVFRVDSRGPMQVKGRRGEVEAFEVVGLATAAPVAPEPAPPAT